MLCEFMNKSDKYQWELLPYFSTKENQGDLSAKHMYGKFLNYVENEDYVGANLAKNFLYKGVLRKYGSVGINLYIMFSIKLTKIPNIHHILVLN